MEKTLRPRHASLVTRHSSLSSGCNVSSRRPPSEGGGRGCKSRHPDHLWVTCDAGRVTRDGTTSLVTRHLSPPRKAGRYKLAAPVSKTGSASPRSEHYRRLPPFLGLQVRSDGDVAHVRVTHHSSRVTLTINLKGDQHDHRSILAQMATTQNSEIRAAKRQQTEQEGKASPSIAGKIARFSGPPPGS
jgi:hypothetical protein